MTRILVAGGCGFIGSNFIRYVLETADAEIVNLDALTYAGNPANLVDIAGNSRYRFVHGSIDDRPLVNELLSQGVDSIINFAAETHVDRSIQDPSAFIRTNVVGTQVLLDAARTAQVGRYLQVSTDEVYGSLGPMDAFRETTPLAPNSPYAASKAAADLLVRSYVHTFSLPAMISRCSNNYGPYQFPEKLIPLFITRLMQNESVPVYGDGMQIRDWLHVRDHCSALWKILQHGRVGEVYNIGGRTEKTNLDLTNTLLRLLGKPATLIQHVPDRPGHDRRYAIDCTKIETELGWNPQITFQDGIAETIEWYKSNSIWIASIRSREYQSYFARQYIDLAQR
jgi:dTDP-glucose 4,6-dehydratase